MLLLVLFVLIALAVVVYACDKVPHTSIKGKNVFITGGSSGIGLSTAREMIGRGAASVAIAARSQATLDKALAELKSLAESSKSGTSTRVFAYSCDVSDETQFSKAFSSFVEEVGIVDIVVASAGVTHPNYFSALPVSEFERLVRINYIGAVVTSKVAGKQMCEQKSGRIVFVSSMAGQVGVHGYTAYSPTKFAVRGLAECLAMELLPYNVRVSVCNPPDVDTPMYAQENETKPEECKRISEGTGVFAPEQLATDICNGIENYKFFIQTGFDGFMLGLLNAGFAPAGNVWEGLSQVLLMGPMRAVALVYRKMYNDICLQVHAERTSGKLGNDNKKKQ